MVLDNHLELIEEEDIPPLLRIRSPSTAVVILTARISDYQLFRAASNEVAGIVFKESGLDFFPGILKSISQGGCFLSPVFAARILHLFSVMNRKVIDNYNSRAARYIPKNHDWQYEEPIYSSGGEPRSGRQFFDAGNHSDTDPVKFLSKMELRILTCIGEGCTSSEIAENLDLAVGTVRNYISTLMRRTGLQNRSQMVRYACYYGLVPR